MTAIIIIAIVVIILVWGISTYNGFVRGQNDVEEAFSTMDVYLKKRYDLIPNLVETVKGYAKHESETLQNVVAARNAAGMAKTTNERIEKEAELTQALRSINVVAEQYPDLKANTNFTELMTQLQTVEGDIANARKYYNGCVKKFNIKLQSFPSNLIGSMFHYEKKTLFEVASEAERENVKVSF
jgi:LemA protein